MDSSVSDNVTAAAESSWSWKVFKGFAVAAALILCAELIWLLGITPFRPFSRIEISGYSRYDNANLLAYAGITPQSSFIFTNARETEALIAALPQIESARVIKRFPGRLDIVLNGRRTAAVAFADAGGITVPVLFDRQGVIFQIGCDFTADKLSDYPVISGIEIEQPVLGMRLPARFFPLLEELDTIRVNAPQLLSAVSEIRINRRSSEGFDLTVFLTSRKLRVQLSSLNENILRYTLLMADVLSAREPGVRSLDFRGNVASYYPKGGYL